MTSKQDDPIYILNKISLPDLLTLIIFIVGLILSSIALGAELLGLNITPGFGVVQMLQLLLGLTALTFAGFHHIYTRRAASPRSLQADVGIRLGMTGLVFCYMSGFSDLIGIGTHTQPRFDRPFVGVWQLSGLSVGILLIVGGLLLYHTSRGSRESSALHFLIKDDK